MIEVNSLDDLLLQVEFKDLSLTRDSIRVNFYCYDTRIGWNTYIIYSNEHGVLGFTNSII